MTTFKKQPLFSGVYAKGVGKFSLTAILFIPVFLLSLALSNYAAPATDYSAWQKYQMIDVTPSRNRCCCCSNKLSCSRSPDCHQCIVGRMQQQWL